MPTTGAINITGDIEQYQGLSSDTKPDAPNGSTFYELNTGITYIRHRGTWYEDLSMVWALSQAKNLM